MEKKEPKNDLKRSKDVTIVYEKFAANAHSLKFNNLKKSLTSNSTDFNQDEKI